MILIRSTFIKYSSFILIFFIFESVFQQYVSSTDIDSEKLLKDSHELPRSNNEDEEDKSFSLVNHQSDHSLYSGRSLMSSSNIEKSKQNNNEILSENDSDSEQEVFNKKNYAEKEWQLMFRSFDIMFDSITSSSLLSQIGKHTNIFDDVVNRLPKKCARDIRHIRDSFKRHKLWAMRMVDAIGKFPSGITYGRFASQGDFEECLSVSVDETVHKRSLEKSGEYIAQHYKFNGKYCLIDFRLPLPERPKDKILSIHDPVIDLTKTDIGRDFPQFINYSGYASVFYEVGYMHAFCLPSSCQVEDLTRSLGQTLEGIHILVNNTVDCQEVKSTTDIRLSQVISFVFLGIIILNASFATYGFNKIIKENKTKDKKSNEDHEKDLSQDHSSPVGLKSNLLKIIKNPFYIDCFSIQTNFKRLTKPDPKGLTFVHYTRIVAMAMTVITHTAAMGTLQAITKPADTSNSEGMFRDLLPQMLANAFTSIQIFFFMAGFMLVISTYPSVRKNQGRLPFTEYAAKRAIRLLPGLVATLCINFLWPLFINGPMVSYFDRMIVEPCENNWWRTLAFLSNFDHVEKMCLRHSYFSASDYQLHMMAFPLLLLLYKHPMVSLCIAALLTVTGFVIQVIIILTKIVLPFMMVDYIDKAAFFNVVHYIHHPSWNHMSAFFYGFIIGYLVVKQIRFNLSKKTIKWTWLTLMPLGLVSIFAPYYWNHYKRPIHRKQMVFYILIDRFILLTTCAWLSYGTMVLGRAPPNDKKNKRQTNEPDELGRTQISSQQQSNKALELPSIEVIMMETNDSGSKSDSLKKQHSSPDLLKSGQGLQTIRPAISSPQVDKLESNAKLQSEQDKKISSANQTNRQEPRASISNVNTLCLALSRLTFQLYLFNMVVLWIDVQHSKYNWYFSYYFIIVKSFAVYICSSIFATIFFVLLESPCLALYIAWVKNSAAKRESKRNQEKEKQWNQSQGNTLSVNETNSVASQRKCFDGLSMRSELANASSVSLVSMTSTNAITRGVEHPRHNLRNRM